MGRGKPLMELTAPCLLQAARQAGGGVDPPEPTYLLQGGRGAGGRCAWQAAEWRMGSGSG